MPSTGGSLLASVEAFPPITFSDPQDGRFDAVLDTPRGLLPDQMLDFEVQAVGPGHLRLLTTFRGQVAPIPPKPEPRLINAKAPEPTSQRRPPYELKYVHETEWGTPTCWGDREWTKDDAGAFTEPTDGTALTLVINEDFDGLRIFRSDLVKRNLDEATLKDRVTRYTAHVAFHLYQMYLFVRAQREASAADDAVHVPGDEELRLEIARVGTTLLRLMEVSR